MRDVCHQVRSGAGGAVKGATTMKPFRMKLSTVCALACVVCVAVPVAALGASITKPTLTVTSAGQSGKKIDVLTEFSISKSDSTYAWKWKICALKRCASASGAGTPSSRAQATTYTPGLTLKTKHNEVGKLIKITTTMTIGSKHWTYTSKHKVGRTHNSAPRMPAVRNQLAPRTAER